MNNKGFTLIELLVTITIMGLLMAIAVPNVTSMVDKNNHLYRGCQKNDYFSKI